MAESSMDYDQALLLYKSAAYCLEEIVRLFFDSAISQRQQYGSFSEVD